MVTENTRLRGKERLRVHRPADVPARFSWGHFFPQAAEKAGFKAGDDGAPLRVEVELGTGRGGFLQVAAPRTISEDGEVGTYWLGVDVARKFLEVAAYRLHRDAERGGRPQNVALFRGMLEPLLADLPSESVAAFHIYFPDPWHKKRHAGRRMLRPDVLHWLHHALVPGGFIHLRTDVPPYFDEMRELMQQAAPAFEISEELIYDALPRPDWIPTNYERRFLKEGFICHALSARKREN